MVSVFLMRRLMGFGLVWLLRKLVDGNGVILNVKRKRMRVFLKKKSLLQSRREFDMTLLLRVSEELILLFDVSFSKTNGVALSSWYHVS